MNPSESDLHINLLKTDSTREKVDITLFRKTFKNDVLVLQIYVDDIRPAFANATFCKEFSKSMQAKFEISLMGELKFFLGIQINQNSEGMPGIGCHVIKLFCEFDH